MLNIWNVKTLTNVIHSYLLRFLGKSSMSIWRTFSTRSDVCCCRCPASSTMWAKCARTRTSGGLSWWFCSTPRCRSTARCEYGVLSGFGASTRCVFQVVSWIVTIWFCGSFCIFFLARALGGEVGALGVRCCVGWCCCRWATRSAWAWSATACFLWCSLRRPA